MDIEREFVEKGSREHPVSGATLKHRTTGLDSVFQPCES